MPESFYRPCAIFFDFYLSNISEMYTGKGIKMVKSLPDPGFYQWAAHFRAIAFLAVKCAFSDFFPVPFLQIFQLTLM